MAERILIGADHFGLPLKAALHQFLLGLGYEVDDRGTHTAAPVDYPDIAERVAREIAAGRAERGILVCGTGAGMAIAANKVPGVRAVAVYDPYTAERARASNNAQIITLGSQTTTPEVARVLVAIFLRAEYQGGRSAPKVAKLNALDDRYRKPEPAAEAER
jgi:ribose 5-phosphate isomerase B